MLFSIHRPLSMPDLSHRKLRQLTQERPRAKSGALGYTLPSGQSTSIPDGRDQGYQFLPNALWTDIKKEQRANHIPSRVLGPHLKAYLKHKEFLIPKPQS